MAQNPSPIHPRVTDARAYEAALRQAYFRPFVARIQRRLATATGTTDVWRALDVELEALLATPRAGVPIELIEAQITRVDGYHRQRLIQSFRSALGVDVRVFLTRPAVAAFMAERISENVALVKTIPPRFHDGLKRRVGEAFREAPFDQQRLRAMLRDEYQSSGYNLRRLTRDQTNKQVGGLSRLRHNQLGIAQFIWRSVQDQRVRTSHADYDGQTYEWANAPESGPGMPVQCRCTAEPSLGKADLDRLGAKATVTTPRPRVEMTPQQARGRVNGEYIRQSKAMGLPAAEKGLRAASDVYERARASWNDWYANEGKPGFTVAERVRRTDLVESKYRGLEAARSVYVQRRLDAERATWREVFGSRKPGAGMDTEILGRPGDAFKTHVSEAVQDFRRMVHGENLKGIGKVEIQALKEVPGSRYGDAGVAYTDPLTSRDRMGGFTADGLRKGYYGRFPDARKRIRVKKDEPGSAHFIHTDPSVPVRGGLAIEPKMRGSVTTIHELGHQLETAYPKMLESADAFIKKRGKDFDWINDYAKEKYQFEGKVASTELVSVGLEQLWTRPAEFARRDPEYFDWIWRWVVRAEGN